MLYAMHCQWGKKTKIAPSSWHFVTPPEENRATAIGNVPKKFGKDRTCGSVDMLADRQTDTHRRADYNTLPLFSRAK